MCPNLDKYIDWQEFLKPVNALNNDKVPCLNRSTRCFQMYEQREFGGNINTALCATFGTEKKSIRGGKKGN